MRAMSLSENDQKMVMTACTEITYSLMQSAIRRIVGSSGSSASGSSIVVKQEAFYSNNRKFNPNYSQKKNYQVQHPNNNGPAYSNFQRTINTVRINIMLLRITLSLKYRVKIK